MAQRAGPALALLLAGACLAAAAVPAAAHPESAAASLRPDVVAAWHTPALVMPHTQWQAGLDLAPGHAITAAWYQVCEVRTAGTCFAPPHEAQRSNDTFWFDSKDYLALGQPVDYQAGWRLGVKWILQEGEQRDDRSNLVAFPSAPPEGCGASCTEDHYLVFEVGPEPARPAPGPALAAAVAGLALAAATFRRRGRPLA